MLKLLLTEIAFTEAFKLLNGIVNFKKAVPVFKLLDKNGNSIVTGSVRDCLFFIKGEEITGEFLSDGVDFGTTKVDGEELYSIMYAGDKIVKNYSTLIIGGLLLTVGTVCYILVKREEKKDGRFYW